MITACLNRQTLEFHQITSQNPPLLKEAIWIDLISPSKEEELLVEHALGLSLPTRDEMDEIEISSRLYKEDKAVFMTAMMIAQSDSPEPKYDPVTFVITERQLITIRYIEPMAFELSLSDIKKLDASQRGPINIFMEVLDTTIDRLADIQEFIGRKLNHYSKTIFGTSDDNPASMDYRGLLKQIGTDGSLNSKARESLVTFNRLLIYFTQVESLKINNDVQQRIATITEDIASITDHANFLNTKINFLLDATLGLVSIEQNNIIKIFSVAAVIFLPPTLVASIYGMNFNVMPELAWKYGYVFAIGMILLAAWLPYKYFKYRKWL